LGARRVNAQRRLVAGAGGDRGAAAPVTGRGKSAPRDHCVAERATEKQWLWAGGVSNTDRDYHKYINVLVDVTICAMPPELHYPAKQETTKRLPVARLRPEGADLLGLQHGDCFASCEGL